ASFMASMERLSALEQLLEEMQSAHNGRIIFEDDEIDREMDDLGSDFLEMFLRHKHINDQAGEFLSVDKGIIDRYRKQFTAIDRKFQSKFYLFEPFKAFIDRYREDSYAPEHCWWLSRDIPEEAANNAILPSLIDLGLGLLGRARVVSCPAPALLAAYAFRELGSNEREKIETHLLTCLTCLEEVASLRYVEASAPIPTYDEIRAMDSIYVPAAILERALPPPKTIVFINELKALLDNYIIQPGKEIAEKISDVIGDMFPGELAFEPVQLRGDEKTQVKIPKKVWFVVRQRLGTIRLLNAQSGQEPLEDIKPLVHFMSQLGSFYYSLYGMGPGKKLRPITRGIIKCNKLPIEIDSNRIEGISVIWLIANNNKEDMVTIDAAFTDGISREEFVFPSVEPHVWIIVYIEPGQSS
ncbi:MAG: hypothetical protein WCQ90_15745, partial [Deltaproteobacteria bacterium]